MTVSHLDNLTINIFLDPSPAPERGFSNVLHLVNGDNNSLNGARFITYTNAADAVADNTAGYIDAGALAAVQTAFSQRPAPTRFIVGKVAITAGPETWAEGLDACLAAGADFYGVTSELRGTANNANMELLGEHVETSLAQTSLIGIQVDNSEFTSGTSYPLALADLDGNTRTILIWHDDTNEYADVAYMVNRLAADPDVVSAPWDAEIQGVGPYTTALTQTAKDFLYNDANSNHNSVNNILPYGPATYFVDPGKTVEGASGRPIYEMVTRDWFEARLQERIAAVKVSESARYNKITIDPRGQAKILSVIEGLLAQGQAGDSPHFIASKATPQQITQADLDAQRLRFTVQAQLAVSARLFTFDVYFTRTPLVL